MLINIDLITKEQNYKWNTIEVNNIKVILAKMIILYIKLLIIENGEFNF